MEANPKLYLLLDGTACDPKDCKKDEDGVLRHKSGAGVAVNGEGEPMTFGDVAAANKADAAAAAVGANATDAGNETKAV